MIFTSEIEISVTIDLAKGEQAIKAVHKAFTGQIVLNEKRITGLAHFCRGDFYLME